MLLGKKIRERRNAIASALYQPPVTTYHEE